jgi:hypothetical protein
MSTAVQIEASRANAQHSTGPVTREGKANSSRNSTSHGLTSKELHIPEHLQAEYDTYEELFEDLCPAIAIEDILFDMALASARKLRRSDIAESQLDTMVFRPPASNHSSIPRSPHNQHPRTRPRSGRQSSHQGHLRTPQDPNRAPIPRRRDA